MKTIFCVIPCIVLVSIAPIAFGQTASRKHPLTPILTTVCKIADYPALYNNKLVKVRGYVEASFEYSMLIDENCTETSIWFEFADGSTPQLTAIVNGEGRAGTKDPKGRPVPPISVHLIRDSNLEQFEHYLAAFAKGKACADEVPATFPPDCTVYRVTATFTGRIDGVSKEVHEAHLRRSSSDRADWKGFGHMAMFDVQIIVQSVEAVVVVDEEEMRAKSKH